MKGKSCLNNLITLYDEMAGLIDEGRAVRIVCLDFRQAFDTVSHKILIVKLLIYGASFTPSSVSLGLAMRCVPVPHHGDFQHSCP